MAGLYPLGAGMNTLWDAVLVGAGPAGSATALGLAERGHRVVLLDRRVAGGDKVCGEGLMPPGVAALERLGVALPSQMGHPFVGIGYHAGRATARARFPGEAGRGVRRLHLDAHLARAVEAHPAIEVRRPVRVRGAQVAVDGVVVRTDHGDMRGRALVAADGLHSPLRKTLGLERPIGPLRRYGARQHFRTVEPVLPWVDVHAGGQGELYLTPVGPHLVNVALLFGEGVARRFRGGLQLEFDAIVAQYPRLAPLLAGAEPVSDVALTGPLRRACTDVVADATVLVGDAAGFVDAVTGEGMSLSLLSAELAVDTLSTAIRSGNLRAVDLRGYSRGRRRLARRLHWLTEIVVWGLRRPRLAESFVQQLERNPFLFSALLRSLA